MFVAAERKQETPVGTVISVKKQRTSWRIPPPASVVNNGFGKKILEKFGWSPGEGLGAQKQGMKTHIRTKIKSNNEGIGYKDSGEEWLKQQNNFSELLANLSSDSTEVEGNEFSENSGKNSLEMKSKQSRARVHYQKFTRGKDLSRYSSKDLAQILGPITVNGSVSKKSSAEGNINHIHRGSMVDYFQKKDVLWPADNKPVSEKIIQTVESENKIELSLNDSINCDESGIQYSGKKKKNKDIALSIEIDNSISESGIDLVCDKQESTKKKKKKEKSTNEDNIANDGNTTFESEEKFSLENNSNSIEHKVENGVCDKKKRKKRKHHDINKNENDNLADIGINMYSEDLVENGLCISSSKKREKKRKEEKQLK